ncbi:UDP-glucoronosyl and UDP-glucosyl transferase [Iocasia frigidifontis]|uniref:UDP-glucoronosyl and UDP-glucosyl transferase n=1 Tax=Iocasia fonsfrigidae TaxID=2682810 RepID=A0A8A7KEB5_9FIRM|nr:nucleotide disphospho-sugar-binding domain-containing protein [Iocasia fonsfrigidae]QTL97779.1 UDP-glucoronosyl and UDP-glucosyl transferase [Iocasia fonsfrigidae]
MKILITPMAAMAETSGPFSRTKIIANACLKKGHEVALCAAEDVNYQPIKGVKNYYAPIPSPFGLPMFLGKNLFKLAQRLGIQKRKTVHSYEEVLHITGAISKTHFKKDVNSIQKAIKEFDPDIVYAEFRIAAIVAAKLTNKKVITSYSYPVQASYASNTEYSKHVNQLLREDNLPAIESVLEIFNWGDLKIVPSIYKLEPIEDEGVIFVGALNSYSENFSGVKKRDKIVVYMGNGTITPKRQIEVMKETFLDSSYEVYIATKQLASFKEKNITVAERFDFSKLMPETIAYINHGGQNSIVDGLVYGVPQIVCPGKIFERKYNAQSIDKIGAGKILLEKEFKSSSIKNIIKEFNQTKKYYKNAKKLGEQLKKFGGAEKIVEVIEKLHNGGYIT